MCSRHPAVSESLRCTFTTNVWRSSTFQRTSACAWIGPHLDEVKGSPHPNPGLLSAEYGRRGFKEGGLKTTPVSLERPDWHKLHDTTTTVHTTSGTRRTRPLQNISEEEGPGGRCGKRLQRLLIPPPRKTPPSDHPPPRKTTDASSTSDVTEEEKEILSVFNGNECLHEEKRVIGHEEKSQQTLAFRGGGVLPIIWHQR